MVYSGLVRIPAKMLSFYHKNVNWKQRFRPFAVFYRSVLHNTLEAELNLWKTNWLNDTSCHQENISSTLKGIKFKSFSNIRVWLRILGTFSVTTCASEQSFCSKRKMNTHTRSTMIYERLLE